MTKNYQDFIKTPVDISPSDINLYKEEGINVRYSLNIEIKGRGGNKKMVIIMMNPSKADKYRTDASVRKVIDYIYYSHPKIKYISILNVIPLYSTESKDLKPIIKKIYDNHGEQCLEENLKENLETIKTETKEADKVILAWGKPAKFSLFFYYKLISEILDELKNNNNIYSFLLERCSACYSLTSTSDPGHPSYATIKGIKKINVHTRFGLIKEY